MLKISYFCKLAKYSNVKRCNRHFKKLVTCKSILHETKNRYLYLFIEKKKKKITGTTPYTGNFWRIT